ncbi:cobaltochelatase subunit CobN, partial [Anaplasma marginale]|uniref:cobaltochelatase subunit CobN n=1 Tax=Anaplasma marginale TaxID=770 RepID=UPI0005B4611D
IDHLTPPMTRAEIYGDLAKLETLIDEYYEAQTLDPYRLKAIASRINQLIKQTNLDKDLGIEDSLDDNSLAQFLTVADGYLCELKEAQIRDGLHILGQCPENKQLRDLIISIARFSSSDRIGLTEAIAKDLNLDFDLFEVRGVMSEVRDIEIETGIHGVEDVPWYVAENLKTVVILEIILKK